MSAVTGAVNPKTWFVGTSKHAGFVLEHLKIVGNQETSKADILARLDTDTGAPLMAVDLVRARTAIEALPWVGSVRVERQLPGTLAITVTERQPFGLWQKGGLVHLIDAKGQVIAGQKLDRFKQLVLFVGQDANHQASRLMENLRTYPDLMDELITAVRVGERRWDLIFKGGVRVKFPEDVRMSKFRRVLETFSRLETEHRLLDRDVTVIDLRVPGQLVMRLNPDARHLVNMDYTTT